MNINLTKQDGYESDDMMRNGDSVDLSFDGSGTEGYHCGDGFGMPYGWWWGDGFGDGRRNPS